MYKVLLLLLLITTISSCIPNKDLVYFQGESELKDSINILQNEPYRLQANDMLYVNIKTSDPELAKLFKKAESNSSSVTQNMTEDQIYFTGYSIDRNGSIRMPYIGEINILGYTTEEVRQKIEENFGVYFKDPNDFFITVKLSGIRFTVLGEVAKSGNIVLYQNEVNIVEAIANAGDIMMTGNRKNVTVFRKNTNGGTERYSIDMTDVTTFDSNNFYIQSNDIVYVAPLKQKSWGTGTTGLQSLTTIITLLSLITTTMLLINTY